VPFAEREQLHHFTREVFVGLALAIARAIQVLQHRRIFRDVVQQLAEIAERVTAQQHVLLRHLLRILDLVLPEVKWLCQKSVMRSVSGDGVLNISRTHHAA
jgi:hypothetical protein